MNVTGCRACPLQADGADFECRHPAFDLSALNRRLFTNADSTDIYRKPNRYLEPAAPTWWKYQVIGIEADFDKRGYWVDVELVPSHPGPAGPAPSFCPLRAEPLTIELVEGE